MKHILNTIISSLKGQPKQLTFHLNDVNVNIEMMNGEHRIFSFKGDRQRSVVKSLKEIKYQSGEDKFNDAVKNGFISVSRSFILPMDKVKTMYVVGRQEYDISIKHRM